MMNAPPLDLKPHPLSQGHLPPHGKKQPLNPEAGALSPDGKPSLSY